MLSKEQIKLFEKKGGKKEDYDFEEVVSDNKKYYISTDADNKVFIVEENDYEDFLKRKWEINKKIDWQLLPVLFAAKMKIGYNKNKGTSNEKKYTFTKC